MELPRIPGLMETPDVHYARTVDGVRIAYSKAGSGPVILWLNGPPMMHAQAVWGIANPFRQALVATNTVIMVDLRGFGLSDRETGPFTVEAFGHDVEAVGEKVAAETFDLVAVDLTTKPALAYVAQNPERVRLLTLVNPPAMNSAPSDSRLPRLLGDMLLADWEMFSENLAGVQLGWEDERRQSVAKLVRSSTTAQGLRHFAAFAASLDLRPHLASVRCPCLVLHVEGWKIGRSEEARELAAALPNATFRSVSNRIGEASRIGQDLQPAAPASGAFRSVLFTDIEAHTAMMQRLGDAKGREVLREHERISREALRAHDGTEIKTIGDSFMASFPSAQKGVECAIALQRAFASTDAAGERLRIRVGINAGEPIADANDLFGASVILAARTKEIAAGGEILVTQVVRQLLTGKGFDFGDRGEIEMKGFEEPVRLYEVRWQDS